MIRIGNILINPEDISSVFKGIILSPEEHHRGRYNITVIFKNGVVKNYTDSEIGLNYEEFIQALMEKQDKEETDKIFRMMAALKSITNE